MSMKYCQITAIHTHAFVGQSISQGSDEISWTPANMIGARAYAEDAVIRVYDVVNEGMVV